MPNNALVTKTFTKDDRRTAIADTLKDASGNAVDLTGHTVAFRMVLQSDFSVKVNSIGANIDSAAAGQVSYNWLAVDVDTVGDYWYWWIVTRTSDGKVEHFPGDGDKFAVKIVAKR